MPSLQARVAMGTALPGIFDSGSFQRPAALGPAIRRVRATTVGSGSIGALAGLGKFTLTKNEAIVTSFVNGPSFALQSFTRISAGGASHLDRRSRFLARGSRRRNVPLRVAHILK
jgi:hypothetical protein